MSEFRLSQQNDYLKQYSALAYCIEPLLIKLGWHGSRRSIIESLPHCHYQLSLDDFKSIMANFDYSCTEIVKISDDLDNELFPCLYIEDDNYYVLCSYSSKHYIVYDAQKNSYAKLSKLNGEIIRFSITETSRHNPADKKPIIHKISSYRPVIIKILIASFIISLISIITPFFVMTVYDKVIYSHSLKLLGQLVLGMFILIAASSCLHLFKNLLIAYAGSHISEFIGNSIFKKIINLESKRIESISLGIQIAKLKELDSLRDFISGPLVSLIIDLPFSILFLSVIYLVAGGVVLIPIAAIAIMLLLTALCHQKISTMVQITSERTAYRQEFLIDSLNSLEQIISTGHEKNWVSRYTDISARAAISNYKASTLTSILNAIGDGIIMMSGLLTITTGVTLVMANQLTIGGLIAVMMLVWKVLTPFKTLQSNIPRIIQIKSSFEKLSNLLQIPSEQNHSSHRIFSTHLSGKIEFYKVSLKYTNSHEAALVNINFKVNPGELIIVGGYNGAGKSSLFKLLTKLYTAQSGTIYLDNKDIRQIDTYELRQLIGYVPQQTQFFYGTIKQNLHLANPLASEHDIKYALEWSDLYDDVMALPQQLDTRLRDNYQSMYSASFLQRLAIARVLVKKPRILLLDEPVDNLDWQSEKVILETIRKIRSRYTVIMITHRPSHFKLADKVLTLNRGHLEIQHSNQLRIAK